MSNKTSPVVFMPDKFTGDFSESIPPAYGTLVLPESIIVTPANWPAGDPGEPIIPNFQTTLGQQGQFTDAEGNPVFVEFGTYVQNKNNSHDAGYLVGKNTKPVPGEVSLNVGIEQWEATSMPYVVTTPPVK